MTLRDEKYLLFTTFRKDGTAVPTPVWVVGLGDDRLGFWTSSGSGKAKRLAHTERVTVQPCDARGRVRAGTAVVAGTATVVSGAQLDEITDRVKAKYGAMTKLTKVFAGAVGIVKRRRMPYADRGVVVSIPA